MSTQPSIVMHWNTVSTANRMLSKLVIPKFGPVQYSLHSVPLGHVLAGGSCPQGQSTAFSPEQRRNQWVLTWTAPKLLDENNSKSLHWNHCPLLLTHQCGLFFVTWDRDAVCTSLSTVTAPESPIYLPTISHDCNTSTGTITDIPPASTDTSVKTIDLLTYSCRVRLRPDSARHHIKPVTTSEGQYKDRSVSSNSSSMLQRSGTVTRAEWADQ